MSDAIPCLVCGYHDRNACRCVNCGGCEEYCACGEPIDFDDASDDLTDKETPPWLE